jgi:CBS domain-containing protein
MNRLKVRDYMSTDVVIISRDATLHDAIGKMLEYNIHGLIVVEGANNRPVGIVTTDDILALIENSQPEGDMPVGEFMSAGLISTDPDYDLQKAVSIMTRNKIHRLPVIKDKKLLGMITGSDIMRVFKDLKLRK